ncbi:hypothetical protein [Halococcus sp. IIIV-5B]|uniref:DUF7123 family protein n=1 Tax=Halococcus sp. IIIV-5B TaxID=2321230 RepID=UPI000E763C04|nr:hypothetical protein [Halococcus sp. IIIV-5B]RJT07097.1 hypothetical protein D3261_03560 [Halococcus sp. IIIV-5B]
MIDSISLAKFNDKQQRIVAHLYSRLDGKVYFKSRQIAAELGLSPKEVGANMAGIQERDEDLNLIIEKWGRSKSVTWKVTAAESDSAAS